MGGSFPHAEARCSSFGVGGQAGLEPAASAYVYAATIPSELLSHNAPGDPGAARLSGLPLGEKSFGNWLITMEGGAGFEPTAFPCAEDALPNVRPAHVRRSAKIARRSGYEMFRGGGGRTRLLMVKGSISPRRKRM